MFDYSKALREQMYEIDELIFKLKKSENAMRGLAEGSVRVTSSHGCQQYYFWRQGASDEEYIPTKDKEFAHKLIQREYDRKVLKKLQKLKKEMIRFLCHYNVKGVDETYERLCKGRQSVITPVDLTDEMFVERWREMNPGGQNPYPEGGRYETEGGELVRSKSEKIIADTLHRMNIPYQYEPQICVSGNRFFYPDFVCLNVDKRKTIYWEHLGLPNASEYATKNYTKLETYERNGILLGDNLILTLESPDYPLDTGLIRKKIELLLS
ncbi:MAG: hypothetical protein J5757_06730 [Lachnospiraceae bacterium]|nr:hypothetical protein [Lachnospiraceae bacterium]